MLGVLSQFEETGAAHWKTPGALNRTATQEGAQRGDLMVRVQLYLAKEADDDGDDEGVVFYPDKYYDANAKSICDANLDVTEVPTRPQGGYAAVCGHCADFDFTNAKLIIPCTEYKPRKQKGQKAPTPAEINEVLTESFGPDWESSSNRATVVGRSQSKRRPWLIDDDETEPFPRSIGYILGRLDPNSPVLPEVKSDNHKSALRITQSDYDQLSWKWHDWAEERLL